MNEEWRDIEGYEGLYQVSNLGRVKGLSRKVNSLKCMRTIPEKIKKLTAMKIGYYQVFLSKDNNAKPFYVHRLVLSAFVKNPESKKTVNHKNLNKKDNMLSNLEWATFSENNKHAYAKGAMIPGKICTDKGEDKHNSIISEDHAKTIIRLLREGKSPQNIGLKTNISIDIISSIRFGRSWNYLGFDPKEVRCFKKRLSHGQVSIIRECYHSGINQQCNRKAFTMAWLAKAFKVGKTTIGNVINGKNYPL